MGVCSGHFREGYNKAGPGGQGCVRDIVSYPDILKGKGFGLKQKV